MLEHVKVGAARAGKTLDDIEILNRSMVYVTDDIEDGRARFRQHFAPYYANPVYNDFLKWAGYEEEGQTSSTAGRERPRENHQFPHRRNRRRSGHHRHRGTGAERVKEQAEAGIDTTIVAPIGAPPPGPEEAKVTFQAFTSDRFRVRLTLQTTAKGFFGASAALPNARRQARSQDTQEAARLIGAPRTEDILPSLAAPARLPSGGYRDAPVGA